MAEGRAIKKGKSYDRTEEVQLCRSYINVGEDPRVGTGQKAKQFWQRVGCHFHENSNKQGPARPDRSLESKWAEIRTEVTRFVGVYAQVEACNESGTTYEDVLQKSHELYKLKHPKNHDFCFLHCWEILRTVPKWMTYHKQVQEPTKVRKQKKEIPSSKMKSASSSIDDEEGAADFELKPIDISAEISQPHGRSEGSKSAKRKSAEQVITDSGRKLQARAGERIANASFKRNEILRIQATLQLFSIPDEVGQSNEFRQYLALCREEEMYALKARVIVAKKRDIELSRSAHQVCDVQSPSNYIRERIAIIDSQAVDGQVDDIPINYGGGFSDLLNSDSPENREQSDKGDDDQY